MKKSIKISISLSLKAKRIILMLRGAVLASKIGEARGEILGFNSTEFGPMMFSKYFSKASNSTKEQSMKGLQREKSPL